MKRIFFLLAIGFYFTPLVAQIPLKGVVTVQNSKTNTGKIQSVKNAEITHPKAKSEVTDDDGKFTLNIVGLQPNSQTQIVVTTHGEFSEYVVVNAKELMDITLGRVTPVGVYICKKGELEHRQAEMVGLNMRKLEERTDADKKRLQKELEVLRQNNDYLNTRYSEIKDSLDIISKNIDKAFERIKEYAKNMVLENLDNKDDNYVKAYHCFTRGALDSVPYFLQDEELELKHKKILQLQEEAKKEKELATILTESAKAKEEYSENSLNELIKEWLLLARTYSMKNDYEKAMLYYEKAIYADSLHTGNLFEYANYLYSIREYYKAESYYLQCLERYRALEQENPKTYLAGIANTLNSLAVVHRVNNEYHKALIKQEESLLIRKKLAESDPNEYFYLAKYLNNLGVLFRETKEYVKALEKYKEALEIQRAVVVTDPKLYLPEIAMTLNNLALLHEDFGLYAKSLEEYEEALGIFRELAIDNPKTYLTYVALVLTNLGQLRQYFDEYSKGVEELEEALQIREALSIDNPKAYIIDVAFSLTALANLHLYYDENHKALEKYEEALKTQRLLAISYPKAYLPDVAMTLNNLAIVHRELEDYIKSQHLFKEALEIYRALAADNPSVYLPDVAMVLRNISITSLFTKEYAKSEQYALLSLEIDSNYYRNKFSLANALLFQSKFSEAEKIYLELSKTMNEAGEPCLQMIFDYLDAFEEYGIIPEACKADVERIKEVLKQ